MYENESCVECNIPVFQRTSAYSIILKKTSPINGLTSTTKYMFILVKVLAKKIGNAIGQVQLIWQWLSPYCLDLTWIPSFQNDFIQIMICFIEFLE